ncbi:MAG: hypothetical protein ACK5LZ_06100 [Anaerorhabdus sp.]
MEASLVKKFKDIGIYGMVVEIEKVDYSRLVDGLWVRTDKGRILQLQDVRENYSFVFLKNHLGKMRVKLKHTSICAVRTNKYDLLKDGDFVEVFDPVEGIYGEFEFVQLFKQKGRSLRFVLKSKDSGEVHILEEKSIKDILTANARFYGIKNNQEFKKKVVL